MAIGIESVWFTFVPLVVLLGVVAAVVLFTRRNLADGATLLTPRRLVEGYIFTVLLVTMLLVSSGLADMVKARIAGYAGMESTYRPNPVYEPGRKLDQEPKIEYDAKAPRRDLLSGAAQFGMGAIIGLLHLFGLLRLSRNEPISPSPVYRLFLIVGLVIYTTAVIVFAVATVKDYLIYRYVGLPPMQSWYQRPVPGEQFAGLVAFLPFWGILVVRLFRYAQARGTSD